ncbi:RlmE family RNA methyltransferase [Desulfovibrio desulfuricans]|uniref:RlmE family RNA methyltransferase n=1 Tax=Desulfovibrio desulfuricans TaxID=876 RepID=UPI0035AFEE66
MKEYRDHYFLKAKRENYPARSVYKLKELDSKFHLLRPGQRVLDLGAAPGSWSLGAAEKVGPRGLVLACDIQSTDTVFPPQVTFMQEDVFNRSAEFEARLVQMGPFDIVISDMAPRTTGTRFTDQARSLDLTVEALAVACLHLKKGGSFVVKIFMGPDIQELLAPMRKAFDAVKSFKPKSSRSESKETFFVGLGFRGQAGVAQPALMPDGADDASSLDVADDAPPGI